MAGIGVLLFLALHIFDIYLLGFGPDVFNALLFLYKGPAARVLEVFLLFGLLFHGLNGLRVVLVGTGVAADRQKALFWSLMTFAAILLLGAALHLFGQGGDDGGVVQLAGGGLGPVEPMEPS